MIFMYGEKIWTMNGRDVVFVPKRVDGDSSPWVRFGSSQGEFERWIPEVCGVCCLKMVGDTLGITKSLNLYELTMQCLARGAFIQDGQTIKGVFHYPLVGVARDLGLKGDVLRLNIKTIKERVALGQFVILSIDLAKVSPMIGSHLILIHNVDQRGKQFLVHDCSNIIASSGANILITEGELEAISNSRGIALYP